MAYESKTLENVLIDTSTGDIQTQPVHGAIALDNANSPASKWFEVLEEGNNGVLAGVYGKELAYNLGTTSFDGDNDKFDQLTNGTKTDINGVTVRTFHGSLPINGRIK